jgi:outer membrane protein assembly factor BamB
MYDAMTGAWILNIANPTAGTLVDGPNGEILSYTLANGMLTMWNASLCIAVGSQKDNLYLIYGAGEIWRPPQGATIAWSGGNQWSVPIASNITGVPITEPETLTGVDNGVALVTAQGGFVAGGQGLSVGGIGYRIDAGYNATTGQLLWGPVNRTLTPYTTNSVVLGDGKYFQYTTETETWSCYSLTTGQLLWGPTTPETSPLDYDDYSAPSVVGYGNLYAWGYGGSIYCYNDTTGAIEWTWSAGNAGYNTPYGVYPLGTFGGNDILADGMLYVSSGHDYTPPLFKGAEIYCINATTGKEIWDEPNFNAGGPALADGYMVWDNAYDNQLYAYGTGPSKTTVTAPDPVTSVGSAMVIRGTVTDISPGSQQNAVAMNFPNGLPCVSDASMSQFMAAAYQQQPMPTNVTGVPVTVSVIDSNGNTRVIGKTTSDASGMFTLTWMPNIPGNYTVIANFAGSGGYYGSYAETSFYATAAPATQAPTNAPATGLATMSGLTYGIAIAVIAIIIAIAIVGLLIIRKKP